jgi:prepilin peptidase dependent protein B
MSLNIKAFQKGLTIVELLVTLVMGLAVSGAILALFVGTVATHNDTTTATQLEEDLSAAMNLMVREIRRAGFDADGLAYAIAPSTTSIFQSDFGLDRANSTTNCLVYSYDDNNNGVLDTPDEEFGWRLRDSAIEMRQDGNGCGDDGWQDITWASYTTIAGLTFDIDTSQVVVELSNRDVQVDVQDVTIRLTGQATLRGGTTITRTLEETVRVRNDWLTEI